MLKLWQWLCPKKGQGEAAQTSPETAQPEGMVSRETANNKSRSAWENKTEQNGAGTTKKGKSMNSLTGRKRQQHKRRHKQECIYSTNPTVLPLFIVARVISQLRCESLFSPEMDLAVNFVANCVLQMLRNVVKVKNEQFLLRNRKKIKSALPTSNPP
jgi:hypothetical protein